MLQLGQVSMFYERAQAADGFAGPCHLADSRHVPAVAMMLLVFGFVNYKTIMFCCPQVDQCG